ncbi:heterokaryon incompatibility protein-domain-containing protein [Xylariaceae sp. AK1471]|nr:heterokaryon incompatibility protein-domain-containing protein [Xylariaceae sp. AK1471]
MDERMRWRDYASKSASAVASTTIKSLRPSVKKYWHDRAHAKQDKQLSAITNPLTYTPLPRPSCIRILKIWPGEFADVMYCSLRVVDLEEHPRFTALSYTWELGASWKSTTYKILRPSWMGGQDNDSQDESLVGMADETKKKIICNNQVAEIQPNLYSCLLQLRQTRPGDYWIDAICIDQNDKSEKAVQIPMLDRIYGDASLTIVWLNSCPTFMSPGIQQLLAWSRNEHTQAAPLFKKDPSSAFAVVYLLSRRWFRRIWVLQEMCISQNLIFWFGEHQLTEHDLMMALDAVKSGLRNIVSTSWGANKFSSFGMRYWGGQLKCFPTNVQLRQLYHKGVRWTLGQWLQATKGRKALDPRDLLYGGMALIQTSALRINTSLQLDKADERGTTIHSQITPIKLWPEIRVDYRASVLEVLINLAACCLSQDPDYGGMQLLSIAARARDNYEMEEYWDPLTKTMKGPLPSWVPNPGNDASMAVEMLYNQGGTHFKACVAKRNNPKISADGLKLYIDAAKLGTIEGPKWEAAAELAGGDLENGSGEESNDVDDESISILVRALAGLGLTDHSLNYGGVLPQGFLQFFVDLPSVYESGVGMFEAMAGVLTGGMARTSRRDHEEAIPTTVALASDVLGQESQKPPMASQALRTGLCGVLGSYMAKVEAELRRARRAREVKKTKETQWAEETERFVSKERELYDRLKDKYPTENWWQEGKERSEEEKRDELDFAEALSRAMWGRAVKRVSGVEGGYLILVPSWVEEGDVVMLVKGGYVPYVFTPYELFLERMSNQVEEWKRLQLTDPKVNEAMVAELKLAENKVKDAEESFVTKAGGWILAGEAYVEGVMNGEVADISDNWFERIMVV